MINVNCARNIIQNPQTLFASSAKPTKRLCLVNDLLLFFFIISKRFRMSENMPTNRRMNEEHARRTSV